MSLRQQLAFWLATLLIVVLLLWLLADVLLPFVAGAALAYLQSPLVDRLERLGLSRTLGALIVIGVVVLVLILIVLFLLPILVDQLLGLLSRIPAYYRRLLETLEQLPWLNQFLQQGDPKTAIEQLVNQATAVRGLAWLWAGGKSVVSFFSLLVVMPVVIFYLLIDWHRMVATFDSWLPLDHRDIVHGLFVEIDRVITAFVRGQLAVCCILGTFYAASLWLVGLNFGWVIGLAAGFLTFVPYVGSLTGLVLAVTMAIVQFWPNPTWMIAVLGVFLIGQFLEGNVLVPNLVGRSVGLHPVSLILAMFVFGYLFGLVGLIVAVPLAAAMGVLSRFMLRQYLASPFYTGAKSG